MATFTTNNSNNGNNDMSSPTSMNNNDNNNNNSPSSNDEGGSVVDIVVVDHKIVNTDREHLEFKLKVDISTGTYYDNNRYISIKKTNFVFVCPHSFFVDQCIRT